MSGEQPYLALNQRLDDTQRHGRNVYMSAATQWRGPHTVAAQVLNEYNSLIKLDPDKFATSYVAFEYIPTFALAAKSSESTAFNCRGYHNNVLTAIEWKGEKGDMAMLAEAKTRAKAMSSIIDTGEGSDETPYGNYGRSDVLWLWCLEKLILGQREIRW